MVKKKTCIFISGQGSNLKNIIYHTRDKNFPINVSLVICNNRNARGITYAKLYNIPLLIINTKKRIYENKILVALKKHKINFICLAGYMKILSKKIISNFRNKIINIHPSLLPKFKGLNTFKRVLNNNEIKTGCTVHYVNKKLDDGKIVIKKFFYLSANDTESSIKKKTQTLEYKAYPEAIVKIFRDC